MTKVSKRKITFLIWRYIFIIIITSAILEKAGIFSNELTLRTFFSFTTLSNGYVLLITILDTSNIFSSNEKAAFWLSKFRAWGVFMILITGLVYHFMITPESLAHDPDFNIFKNFDYGNIITHYFVPAGMFFDWLLFDKKGRLGKWDPFIFISIPTLYLIFAGIYAYFGPPIPGWDTSFAYFFMDWETLGVMGVVKWISLMSVGILSLAYLIYLIDYFLAKKMLPCAKSSESISEVKNR